MVYPEVAELAIERAMAYLRTRLSGDELGRYEGYYGVFRDYGADEGTRHYKSFQIIRDSSPRRGGSYPRGS